MAINANYFFIIVFLVLLSILLLFRPTPVTNTMEDNADVAELEETIGKIKASLQAAEVNYGEHVSEAAKYMKEARVSLAQFKNQLRETVQNNRQKMKGNGGGSDE